MLIDSKPTIVSISYSEITHELVIRYSDNSVEKYINVPKDVYESIVNNGRVMSDYLKESLNIVYKKMILV